MIHNAKVKNKKSKLLHKNKKQVISICLLLIVLLGISLFSFRKWVTAQIAGQGLQVSPPSQEITIDPGATVMVKAKIRNPGNATLPIQVHVEDFTAKGDEGQIELNSNSPYSVASWTKVSPTSFELDPGGEQEVTATITAPKNAAGGHFGSFIFGVQPEKTTGNTAALSQEIASLFLVRVSGPVNENLAIQSFRAPAYSEFGPIPFNIEFANKGNVYVKTYGLINVTDMFGHKVDDIVVRGVNIFPQANRIVASSLNKKFLFGTYTATALMYYGSVQNQSITATTTFFVFPTRIFIVVIVVLLILYLLRKRLNKAFVALFGK